MFPLSVVVGVGTLGSPWASLQDIVIVQFPEVVQFIMASALGNRLSSFAFQSAKSSSAKGGLPSPAEIAAAFGIL